MFIGRLRNALTVFSQMKGPFNKFSTHSNIVQCQKMTDLVLKKLQQNNYLCSHLDRTLLTDYLKQKISPFFSDHSGFPLTCEIVLSKETIKTGIVPCKIVISHTTIAALMKEKSINEEEIRTVCLYQK